MTGDPAHWDAVYTNRGETEVSWYQREPAVSMRLMARWAPASGPIIDIGAGRAHLADALVASGRDEITVLDISAAALAGVRARLGAGDGRVQYVCADICDWAPDRRYGAWHDRAVFHFLTDPADQTRYAATAARAVAPGGVVILAAFAPDGPERCSGLPVARADAADLAGHFTDGFAPVARELELHRTPTGAEQPFVWVVLRRQGATDRTPPERDAD